MDHIEVRRTGLDGVLLITPPGVFADERGTFVETYNREMYARSGIEVEFVQDDISVSHRGVLRGLHGDSETWKLVTCLHGQVFLVVVNWLEKSKQFKKWERFDLSDSNRLQVLIPPGFATGYQALSEGAVFHYKQSTYYRPGRQFTVRWDDASLAIPWPLKNPLLSARDREV